LPTSSNAINWSWPDGHEVTSVYGGKKMGTTRKNYQNASQRSRLCNYLLLVEFERIKGIVEKKMNKTIEVLSITTTTNLTTTTPTTTATPIIPKETDLTTTTTIALTPTRGGLKRFQHTPCVDQRVPKKAKVEQDTSKNQNGKPTYYDYKMAAETYQEVKMIFLKSDKFKNWVQKSPDFQKFISQNIK